jgi:hypothetical protein
VYSHHYPIRTPCIVLALDTGPVGTKTDEVTGEWRKFHSEELHNLYSTPDIIRQGE